MKITLSNFKMEQMLLGMKPLLQQRGRLGYAAARNFRTLTDALTEYQQFKDELIRKYGETLPDGRAVMKPESPQFHRFLEELTELGEIEQEVEIRTVPAEEALQLLTGEEILASEWMLEDSR